MNTVYRLVWHTSSGTWVVASELAKAGARPGKWFASLLVAAATLVSGPSAVFATEAEDSRECQVTVGERCIDDSPAGPPVPPLMTPLAFDNNYISIVSYGAAAVTGIAGDIAIGGGSQAVSTFADSWHANIALGVNAVASGGNRATAIGLAAHASATDTIALGYNTQASAVGAVAIGSNSVADRANTVSMGDPTVQRQIVNVAAGTANTDVVNVGQLKPAIAALGGGAAFNADGTLTGPTYGMQGGSQATVGAALDALDSGTSANALNISRNTGDIVTINSKLGTLESSVANGIAYDDSGRTSVTLAGASGTIVGNVARGAVTASSSEAVNGAQLFETDERVGLVEGRVTTNEGAITTINTKIDSLESGVANGIAYDDASRASVTLAGASGTVIGNVASGEISATSGDAVNGSQLFATNERVGSLEGQVIDVVTRVGGLDSRMAINEGDIDDLKQAIGDGSFGIVRQDPGTGVIAVGGGLAGGVVDLSGTGGPRALSGIANGSGDSDAVTIAQLKAAGVYDPVEDRILGALVYDDIDLGRATLGGSLGTTIGNLAGGAIAAGSMEAINGGQLFDVRSVLQGQLDAIDGRVGTIEGAIADGSIGGGGGTGNDGGGRPIENVGDGVRNTDAANVGQVNRQVNEAIETAKTYTDTRFDSLNKNLDDFKGAVDNRFRGVDRKIDRMGAISAANTQMAINAAGAGSRGRLAMGVGYQNDRKAMAVGYAKQINERTRMSIGAAFSGSQNSLGAGIGVDL